MQANYSRTAYSITEKLPHLVSVQTGWLLNAAIHTFSISTKTLLLRDVLTLPLYRICFFLNNQELHAVQFQLTSKYKQILASDKRRSGCYNLCYKDY